ncbi:uncharacterized protein LOC121371163 [Gigantopelta aegis]|uniref:uncharacterized protein LOC121371163 n=1 Tax=Gigantopelta aegis TaxID=1735272 RepID=UPI001B88CD1C|nr:uncharacterized protein LOC121371163 [Gigantopelta aegis]
MWLCSVILMQLTWSFVNGHSRFVCPRPQSPRSDIYVQLPEHPLNGMCGLGDTINFDTEYMDVSPGPFTVRFEETVLHKDSPFQISLHQFDDFNDSTTCVLLDHIPHNNNAVIINKCKQNDYPIGHCDGSMYYITVNIPDISCNKCYLKLTHISTDTATDLPCGSGNNTCRSYISCANIKISSSSAGKLRNLSFCENYVNNLMGPWPFRPKEYYMTFFNTTTKVLNATARLDEFARSFILDLPSQVYSDPVEKVEILYEVTNGNTTTVETLFTQNIVNQSAEEPRITTAWNGLNSSVTKQLQDEMLILKLFSSKQSVNGTINFSHEHYGVGKYDGSHAVYSHQGWLSGPEFIGAQAMYPAAVSPFGSCVEVTSNYIAFLHSDIKLSNVHGVLGMSFLDERVHVTLAITGLMNNITSVFLTGPALAGSPTMMIPVTTNTGPIHLTLNASVQIQDIDSLKFLNQVTVTTHDPVEMLHVELEEGIHALITDHRQLYGAGVFQITKGRWLKYEVVLKKVEGHISYVTLNGPERWGFGGPILYKLTKEVVLKENGDVFIEGTIQDLSSDFLLALWKGLITINIKTQTNQSENMLTGKLTSPGIWYCTDIKGAPCSSVNLVPEKTEVDDGAEVVPATGIGSFVLDRANVLQYSILVENSQVPIDKVLQAEVVHGSKLLLTIQLHPSDIFNKAFEVHSLIPQPTFQLMAALSTDELKLRVLEVDGRKGRLTGNLPRITRTICTHPQNFIVGDGHGYWSQEAAPIGSLYTLEGDQLIFTYSGNDSVHLMASKDHFDKCDFANSTQIGAPPHTSSRLSRDYRLQTVGQLFFTSQASCNSTPPLKLIVKVLHTVPKSVDVSECGTSLYEIWRKQELNRYSTPNPAGAAVGGVVFGIIIVAIFIVWDRRNHDKKSGDASMFERF